MQLDCNVIVSRSADTEMSICRLLVVRACLAMQLVQLAVMLPER